MGAVSGSGLELAACMSGVKQAPRAFKSQLFRKSVEGKRIIYGKVNFKAP